jgi:SAM-dependent methyltransferase
MKTTIDERLQTLTADLHRLGYTHQTSVDFSQVVIDAMKSKYAQLDTQWILMDVRELDLRDASVDIAVDKGTLDAFVHGSLWDPPDDVRPNVAKYVDEVARVLKPGGLWLYVTYRQPHFMKPLLTREKMWGLSVEILEDPDGAGGFDYFGFVMERHHQEKDSSREVDSDTGNASFST